MTEKERNCLLRIAGELVELCRTSERPKVVKTGDTSEETYIDPLGPMPNHEELEQRSIAKIEDAYDIPLNSASTPEEIAQRTKRALEDMGIDCNEETV